MTINGLTAAIAATIAMGAASTAQAAGTSLSIQSGVDSNLYTYTGGTSYPPSGSTVTISGTSGDVDFTLANFFPASFMAPDVGVVQTGDGAATSITIAMPKVTVGAATVFYSLINSTFGQAPNTIGNLTLNFEGGATYQYDLTEGDNVRDHFNGIFNNSAPNIYGTAEYTGPDGVDRLDAQQIALPGSYNGDVLTSITLNNTDPANGNPFLAAFTVVDAAGISSATPEPAAWAMMLMGFGGLGAALRSRRRTMVA
jgi:MYXO-CTERM domain-containing protein